MIDALPFGASHIVLFSIHEGVQQTALTPCCQPTAAGHPSIRSLSPISEKASLNSCGLPGPGGRLYKGPPNAIGVEPRLFPTISTDLDHVCPDTMRLMCAGNPSQALISNPTASGAVWLFTTCTLYYTTERRSAELVFV